MKKLKKLRMRYQTSAEIILKNIKQSRKKNDIVKQITYLNTEVLVRASSERK